MTGKTLTDLLLEGVNRFNDSNKPAEIIDNAIEKLFKDSIDSEFRSYGDFGKMVQNAVKQALPANIQDIISLTKYNKLIVDSLQKQWSSSGVEQDFINKANNALNEIINEHPIPEYIYLSDLLKAFTEEHAERAMEENWERPDIRIEEDDVYSSRYCRIYFDRKPRSESSYLSSLREEKSKYSLRNSLACRGTGEKIKNRDGYINELNEVYEVYSATIEDKCVGKLLLPTNSEYQNLIIALYYGQSKLVIDCDESEIYYPNQCD